MLDPDIWAYSSVERTRFWQYLEEQTRLRLHVEDLARYKELVAEYEVKRRELEMSRAKVSLTEGFLTGQPDFPLSVGYLQEIWWPSRIAAKEN